jgi:hypothetical protein
MHLLNARAGDFPFDHVAHVQAEALTKETAQSCRALMLLTAI